MKDAEELIKKNKLFKSGDTVGVACSGGIDSMSLLHYLNSVKEDLDIEIVAINVDHCIRPESENDTAFVVKYCKEHKIRCYKFRVDATLISKEKKIGLEESARQARYGVFEALIEKGIVDKIALAHHEQDQIETIFLNLLRGTGLKGMKGMDVVRSNFIRPFLTTKKREILNYAYSNNIPFVEDSTNNDIEYSRNLLRNKILPLIRDSWPNFDANILGFSKICKLDDEYINSTISFDDVVIEKNTARIPLYYFVYKDSVVNRIVRYAFEKINGLKDIETKHINIIKGLVKDAENGVKINLPNNITAHKEYDYLTLTIKEEKLKPLPVEFTTGKKNLFNSYSIKVKKTKNFNLSQKNCHLIDVKKLPKNVEWRTREDGDVFEKFGGGSKKLKNYFIDNKIPSRIRNEIPVLALGKEIYIVLGYEISNKVKIDENTKMVYEIEYK